MRYKASILFVGLLWILSACGAPAPVAVATSPAESATAITQPTAVPPSPIPDTPAPPVIDAPLVDAPALVKIRFLNELDGWGLTDTAVVRTNDGGVTWYNMTPPNVAQVGATVNFFVLDNEHAWLQVPDLTNYPNAGTLYKTSDAGLTWTFTTVPFSSANLTFLDAANGWMLADLGAGAGSEGVAVFQTTDGGATWQQTYTNDPNNSAAQDSLPLSGLKNGLTPLNMNTAWVSGVVYSDSTVYFYRTDDGGAHWSQVTSLILPPVTQNMQVSFEPVQFASAQAAFVAVRIPTENAQLAIFTSTDAGDTWAFTPTLIPNGSAVDALSASDLFIYAGTQFYVTQDAARTWSVIPADAAFIDTFVMMDFVSPSTGWVLTLDANDQRALYRTTDGGATWSPMIP